jgi:hypothetical protein
LDDDLYLDSMDTDTLSKYINDGKKSSLQCNVLFHLIVNKDTNSKEIWFEATKDISPDEELLADYGKDYWKMDQSTNKRKKEKTLQQSPKKGSNSPEKSYVGMQSPEKRKHRKKEEVKTPTDINTDLSKWLSVMETAIDKDGDGDGEACNEEKDMPIDIQKFWQLLKKVKSKVNSKRCLEATTEDEEGEPKKKFRKLEYPVVDVSLLQKLMGKKNDYLKEAQIMTDFIKCFKTPLEMSEDSIKTYVLLANVRKSPTFYEDLLSEDATCKTNGTDNEKDAFRNILYLFLEILYSSDLNMEIGDTAMSKIDLNQLAQSKQKNKDIRKTIIKFISIYNSDMQKNSKTIN